MLNIKEVFQDPEENGYKCNWHGICVFKVLFQQTIGDVVHTWFVTHPYQNVSFQSLHSEMAHHLHEGMKEGFFSDLKGSFSHGVTFLLIFFSLLKAGLQRRVLHWWERWSRCVGTKPLYRKPFGEGLRAKGREMGYDTSRSSEGKVQGILKWRKPQRGKGPWPGPTRMGRT